MPGKRHYRRRTKVLVALLLGIFGWLAFRSVRVYQLRKMAWDASEARLAGDWVRLETLSSDWAEHDRESALPLLLAAEAAEKRGAMERVAAYLERLPPDDPRTPDVMLELATLYFGKLNQPQAGVAACQRALEIDPDHGEAHRRLMFYYGITLQRIKMVQQAREAIRRGCESPEAYVYLVGANWLTFSNAYELNGKWLLSGSDDETFQVAQMIHWVGASGLQDAADFVEDVDTSRVKQAEHERLLRETLKQYPNNPELLAYFLDKSAIKGDIAAVEELLSQVPATAAEDNRFWHFKGWLHMARGELPAAESAYRKALELHPYAWRTQFELAGLLRQRQQIEETESMIALSLQGKQLRKTILQLPDVQSVPKEVLYQMQEYAEKSGDDEVAKRLAHRLGTDHSARD